VAERSEGRGCKTLLIVEDQTLLREVLLDFLRNRFPGCRFLEAADGAGAFRAVCDCRPALILMDKCLPDADGIELTARLTKLFPETEVIVMSSWSGDAYAQHALAAGARLFLSKDSLTAELIPAVEEAFGISAAFN